MSEWLNKGTGHFLWRSKGNGEWSQVTVDRREWPTVSVSVSAGGSFNNDKSIKQAARHARDSARSRITKERSIGDRTKFVGDYPPKSIGDS